MVLLRTFQLDYCSENLQKTTHLNKKNLPSDPQHAHLEGPLPQEGPNHIGSVRDIYIYVYIQYVYQLNDHEYVLIALPTFQTAKS